MEIIEEKREGFEILERKAKQKDQPLSHEIVYKIKCLKCNTEFEHTYSVLVDWVECPGCGQQGRFK